MRCFPKEKFVTNLAHSHFNSETGTERFAFFIRFTKGSYLFDFIITQNTSCAFRNLDGFSNLFFHCHNPTGIKYITKVQHDVSELGVHKIKPSFQGNLTCKSRNNV